MTVRVTAPMLAAYDHFISAGFTEDGAAAPVGNGCQESGEFLVATMFRAHPDYSGGVPEALKSGGFEEWLGDRKTACIAFIGRAEARLGVPAGSLLNDLGTQCDFVVYELQTNKRYATLLAQLTEPTTKSIATLTANFMAIYEVPALATANLDNRIAHAEAVVAMAKGLRGAGGAPPTTQPAPPAPQPKAPAATLPPAAPAMPASPAALPPTSTTSEKRRQALADMISGMVDQIAAEQAALKGEVDDFREMVATLQEKHPETAAAVDTQSQGNSTVFGITHWKTTLSGIAAILTAAGAGVHALQTGDLSAAVATIPAIMAGVGLIAAQDATVK